MPNEGSEPPSASDSLVARPQERGRATQSPAAILLSNFMTAMGASGDGAEQVYQTALRQLREQADSVVVEIARKDSACAGRDYPTRWALVHAAAELKSPAALAFLTNLVLTPIPPEESPDPHFSTVAEETILRTTAVEGVGALAQANNREALAALFEFLKQPSISIRRAAVRSILRMSRGRTMRRRIAAILPQDQQFLLDLKPMSVGQVPQIKRPERHLTEAARRRRTEAPPSLAEGEPGPERQGSESPLDS